MMFLVAWAAFLAGFLLAALAFGAYDAARHEAAAHDWAMLVRAQWAATMLRDEHEQATETRGVP